MKSLYKLQPLILEWAKEKNLLLPENAPKQKLKLIEECGELASAIIKNNIELQKDAIGDVFVVLVILAEQTDSNLDFDFTGNIVLEEEPYEIIKGICYVLNCVIGELNSLYDVSKLLGLDLTECANIAWNEIKDRTGKTVDGTFIKDK